MAALGRQIGAVVGMNLRSLPSRASLALVTLVAVAIVVAVLLGFLAMANGFTTTMAAGGAADVAILLRDGSENELNSTLSREQASLLLGAPDVARGPQGPIGSAELYVIVNGIKRDGGTRANLPLRGMDVAGVEMRNGVRIVEGRMFQPGTNEILVGESVLREFDGFELGRELSFSRTNWKVVGVFTMNGSVFESELWADARSVQSLFQRGNTFQTMRLKLAEPAKLDELKAWVEADPRLKLDVKTEQQYFAKQSERTNTLIKYFGWTLSIAMACGALAGALNTMFTTVAQRARDIATLRALGFSGAAAFIGTLVESLVIAAIGGLIGALAVFSYFDGLSTTTLGSSFTQVVFRFDLTPALLLKGVLLAVVIGFVGGVFPAWQAARTPVAVAFRL
jgi:putative ABC transport system permease protein